MLDVMLLLALLAKYYPWQLAAFAGGLVALTAWLLVAAWRKGG